MMLCNSGEARWETSKLKSGMCEWVCGGREGSLNVNGFAIRDAIHVLVKR